uniref:protein FAM169B isoform X4 n=1 Tax=Callithrix jacchus TaxID=9483 RepID=UPI0023DD4DE1|nr:protein FAM169B isoform X4 [Callithrix jacchus]
MRQRSMRGSRGQPPGRGAVLPEPGMKPEAACGAAAGVYPVDILDDDPDAHRKAALACYTALGEGGEASSEVFCLPTGEQVKLEASSVCFCTVHRDEPQHKILVLVNPQDTKTVVAVYIKESWWSTEDAIRTSDPAREGLMKVQSFGERIVLFILNVIIFGRLERNLDDDDMFFLPHSVKEQAKILWRHGAAVGFYTTKMKGSLCGSGTGACYLLPVFDTVFVRRKHRRQGLGTAMLRDFCATFPDDEALGVSCPISPAMYQVCRQFLFVCPEERGRLWEVKPPGAWGQRINIWLKVQLQPRLPDWQHTQEILRRRTSAVMRGLLGMTDPDSLPLETAARRGCVEKSWKTQRMIQTMERRRRTWGWWASCRASLQGPVPDASGCPGCPSGPGPEACLGSQDLGLRLV